MSLPILREAWRGHRGLVTLAAACVPCALAVLMIGAVDARTITGAPAWNKPLKFFLSAGVYAVTFAWYLAMWPPGGRGARLRAILGDVVAAMLALELLLIAMQAARGVGSHFNVGTPIDRAIFNAMGLAILTLAVAHAALWGLLLRARWDDRATLSACRWGAGVSLAGLLVGALMVVPTPAQREALRAGTREVTRGAHTVGRADGGPGLPFVGWSTEAGDRRVPHFVGLHAMQVVPLALLPVSAMAPRARQRLVTGAGVACLVLTVLAWLQAEAGRPVNRTGTMLGVLSVLAVLAWGVAMREGWRRDRSTT
ncbi:hypothetical protein TBR22_A45630 [Luteitalea sp. TBR-22]|uniref:hypothetical protein n=1 Tax=Luteitalea sp. TBR-22 TaxID=2802971 RepID=UPI001AF219D6|nr:hypothetical protein [Luteitalea sp. TBR-22]BCS35336.1 hypothetical protein TBR22_A45630 [Luteitalea sp. TBR-22]